MELWLNAAQPALAEPMVAREVKRLLRRAGAFDRHGWLREESTALPQPLHQLPCIPCEIGVIVRGDAVLAKSFPQTGNGVPVEFKARRSDQDW